jgi:hypothetical protein
VRKRLLAVDPPTVRSRPATVLTVPQIRHFLRVAAEDGYAPVWLLPAQAGLRRGAVLGLRCRDVDRERKRLHVRHCAEVLDGAAHLTTPESVAALSVHRSAGSSAGSWPARTGRTAT